MADEGNQYLFDNMRSSQGLSQSTEDIAKTWWADWRNHPFGALCWISLGVAASYVAVIDQITTIKLLVRLRRTKPRSTGDILSTSHEYNHGLWLLTALEDLKIFGLLIFTVLFSAIFYLVFNPDLSGAVNSVVLSAVLIATYFVNGIAIFGLRWRVSDLRNSLFDKRRAEIEARRKESLIDADQVGPLYALVVELRARVDTNEAHRLHDLPTRTAASRVVNLAIVLLTVYASILAVIGVA